ncbi:endonuclease/exonuclease/phosphatase family protein [Cryptosporangium arvum]|uniref:endonuclease/exonuclease/phosphatase family protein n=1 Tax=Cryptosporangium arvum TaxID=80871 RepID=UPI0004B5E4DC|nr:endonuclease/exonuclease/phosphatase family protein [Cryptosporangium arvum]
MLRRTALGLVLVGGVLVSAPAQAATATRIHDVQGTAHVSPLRGTVVSVPGVVTAKASNGFYLQDPRPDRDQRTSEAILVFTGTAPTVAVGDAVTVEGTVTEFRPGGADGTANLTTTELTTPTVTVTSAGNPLPAPTVLGAGGRRPPTTVIDDDAKGDVEAGGKFDPATDGIDFYESLESMRVRVGGAVAVGPTNSFNELPVLGDRGRGAGPRSVRGGIVVRPDDANPERIILDDGLGFAPPKADVGATAARPAEGVVSYGFGNFKVILTAAVSFTGTKAPETTRADSAAEVSVATFNVENLDPNDPPAKFARLASIIVGNLRAPDILALEEVQDNTGATNDGTVAADRTYGALIAAITAAGGPAYAYRQIDPVNNADGGEPGGNIRVGFLYAASRGVSFASAPAGDAATPVAVTSAGHLSLNPGRIAPADTAWADSRKPLAGEFVFRGRSVFVIANHFVSKGGDQPLFGRFQPPAQSSAAKRGRQAALVNTFVKQLLAKDPQARIAVVGDLNDFEFSPTVKTLAGSQLVDLPATLPVAERYTYVFDGNSQVLDHILLSRAAARAYSYDVVHVNAEYADQASDHDPQLVRLTVS